VVHGKNICSYFFFRLSLSLSALLSQPVIILLVAKELFR